MIVDHFNTTYRFIKGNTDQCIGWCYTPERTFASTSEALKSVLPEYLQNRAARGLNISPFLYSDLMEMAYNDGFYLSVGGDMRGFFDKGLVRLYGPKYSYEAHKGNCARPLVYRIKKVLTEYLLQKIADAT